MFFFWHSRLSPQKLIRLFELKLTVEVMSACVFWAPSWVVAFRNAGYLIHSFVEFVERNGCFHIIKYFSIFLQNVAAESEIDKSAELINVLICEANTAQFDE